MTEAFRSWPVAGPGFDVLAASAQLEDLGRGRRGAVLVDGDDAIPIVRTTTAYRSPAQRFAPLHLDLARAIARTGALPHAFNNALLEHYTHAYATMKRHSDQALDLADESWIAVYSCYRDPARASRRLVVKSKEPASTAFDIPLEHDTVVAFSLATNRSFTHAIVLRERAPANDWLGLTFRTSKTFVRYDAGTPRLATGAPLTLATEAQRRELFEHRRRENAETSFAYPAVAYTISESDLRPPVPR